MSRIISDYPIRADCIYFGKTFRVGFSLRMGSNCMAEFDDASFPSICFPARSLPAAVRIAIKQLDYKTTAND